MKFETFCKLCGESIEVPEEEVLLPENEWENGNDHVHAECQMDEEEYKNPSPSDFF
jgi:hypothetical protein